MLNHKLTLRELEATTCLWTTWLLTLYLTGITCHEAFCTQGFLVFFINLDQGTCDCETQSLALTCITSATQCNFDIILLGYVKQVQRLLYDILQDWAWEVVFHISLIDSNLTSTFGNIYAGDCALATTQCIYYCHIFILFTCRG